MGWSSDYLFGGYGGYGGFPYGGYGGFGGFPYGGYYGGGFGRYPYGGVLENISNRLVNKQYHPIRRERNHSNEKQSQS
ncbi:unnamed protein product [Rotaria sp. Silwood1]|nr:unnamed protein product [Rotaria sp. Silwood1]CAF4736577.1 unnamed protein product [Rotaria sp. Silwood1]